MNTLSLRRMFKLFIGKLLELCPNINKSLIERFFFTTTKNHIKLTIMSQFILDQ